MVAKIIGNKFATPNLIRLLLVAGLLAIELMFGLVVAVRSAEAWLLLGAVFGLIVIPLTLVEPVIGLYLFVGTLFTEALLMVGPISVTRVLGMLLVGAWLARALLLNKRLHLHLPPQGWWAVLFIGWGFISAGWATDLQKLFAAVFLLIQGLIHYVVIIDLLNTAQKVRITLTLIVAVNLIVAAIAIVKVISGDLEDGRVNLGQFSVDDINSQAAYLIPSAVILLLFFSYQQQLLLKGLALGAASLVILAILATASRGAMVALAVIVLIGLVIDFRLGQVALPALILGSIAVFFLPPVFVERFDSIFTFSDRGAGRGDIWLVALEIIRANPLLGVGLDNFGVAFDRYLPQTAGILSDIGRGRGSHNTLLNVQSELGLVGLGLFVTMVGCTLQRGWRAIRAFKRQAERQLTMLATAVWLALIGLLVAGLFIEIQYWKLFWLGLALPEIMYRLAQSPRPAAKAAPGVTA